MRRAARVRRAGIVLVALVVAISEALSAQSRACADAMSSARTWPAPLDHRVTMHASGLSLRDALDQLSRTAGVQLSYASELIGVDRRVCVRAEEAPLGDVLLVLLAADGVAPVVVGGQVVLAAPRDACRFEHLVDLVA